MELLVIIIIALFVGSYIGSIAMLMEIASNVSRILRILEQHKKLDE